MVESLDIRSVKVIMLGRANAGKTSIGYKYVNDIFTGDMAAGPTLGCDYFTKQVQEGEYRYKL